jgi:hypothetical protein
MRLYILRREIPTSHTRPVEGNCSIIIESEANSAWQVLSVIAFNLMRGFQTKTTARQDRPRNRKRRTLRRFELIHTLRYRFLNRAGLIVCPNGKATLDVGDNALVRERFNSINSGLSAA